jgi:hypothetical protein
MCRLSLSISLYSLSLSHFFVLKHTKVTIVGRGYSSRVQHMDGLKMCSRKKENRRKMWSFSSLHSAYIHLKVALHLSDTSLSLLWPLRNLSLHWGIQQLTTYIRLLNHWMGCIHVFNKNMIILDSVNIITI